MKTKATDIIKNIKEEWKEVSPDMASAILTEHYKRIEAGTFTQRPVTTAHVLRYTAEMNNDAFQLSPVPLSFDSEGNLIDGQHRLEAVRKSGKPQWFKISRGWPVQDNGAPSTKDILDVGKVRTLGQLLHMHGVSHANNYGSSIRFMARVAWSGSNSPIVPLSQVLYFLQQLNLQEAIDRIMARASGSKDFKSRTVGPLAYYYTTRPNKALAFAEGLFRMEFGADSPVKALLQWEKNRREGSPDSGLRLRALCSALRAHDGGMKVDIIRPTTEAIEWLSNMNPELRAKFREHCPRS